MKNRPVPDFKPSLLNRLYDIREGAQHKSQTSIDAATLEEIICEMERLHKRVETLKQMV